jgi:hypothetical protein
MRDPLEGEAWDVVDEDADQGEAAPEIDLVSGSHPAT